MLEEATLQTFIAAIVLLLLVPGPVCFFIISRTLSQGRMAGLMSILGISAGALVHVCAAALGLAQVLAMSGHFFQILKFAGSAYLIYLGLAAYRRETKLELEVELPTYSKSNLFYQGLLVNLFHPKTALFFLAFLPQFIKPADGVMLQTLELGLIFISLELLIGGLWVLLAGIANRALAGKQLLSRGHYVEGTVLLILGVGAAVSSDLW